MSVDWKVTLRIVARIITDHFYFQNFKILVSCTHCQSWSVPLIRCLSMMSWASYTFYFIRNLRSPDSSVSTGIGCGLDNQVSIPSRGSRKSVLMTLLWTGLISNRHRVLFIGGEGVKTDRTCKWPFHLLRCWMKCLQPPINVHGVVLITRRESSPSLSSPVRSDSLSVSVLVVLRELLTVLSEGWHADE